VPIVCLTPLVNTARRMVLTWGTHCALIERQDRFKGAVIGAVRVALRDGFAEATDKVVVIAGVPFNVAGSTNILRVAPCDERLLFKSEAE